MLAQFGVKGAITSRGVNEDIAIDNQRLENKIIKLTSLVRQLAIGQHHTSPARVYGICAFIESPTDACPTLQETDPNSIFKGSIQIRDMSNGYGQILSQTIISPKANVNAITLRSGMELPQQQSITSNAANEKAAQPIVKDSDKSSTKVVPLPFPSRAVQVRKFELNDEFLKVEINIPLLDAIKLIPNYSKFLKELCIHKRKKLKGVVEMGKIDLEPIGVIIQLANRSIVHPLGILERHVGPNMEGESSSRETTLVLGKSFLMTLRTKIDVHVETLSMEFSDNMVQFNIFEVMRHPIENHSIFCLDVIDLLVDDYMQLHLNFLDFLNFLHFLYFLEFLNFLILPTLSAPIMVVMSIPLVEKFVLLMMQLKLLLEHLKYAYLKVDQRLPVIIANNLYSKQKERLLGKCLTSEIAIESSIKRWLNLTIIDVEKKEAMKLLLARIIYPIQDTRVKNSWGVWIDYKKLNLATHKDHFPLPFIDQVICRFTLHQKINIRPPTPIHLAPLPKLWFLLVYKTPYAPFKGSCMESLSRVLDRWIETNLVLNFEKCHFMVIEDIVLGHLASSRGVEVDRAKIDIISFLTYLASVSIGDSPKILSK
ncbi:hypothetical protein CR513_19718, partial [Mucuna pruriens]